LNLIRLSYFTKLAKKTALMTDTCTVGKKVQFKSVWTVCVKEKCWDSLLSNNSTRVSNLPQLGVNFINDLHASFVQKSLSSFFLLTFWLWIFRANFLYKKCAHKMMMKLTTGVNFINISLYKVSLPKFRAYLIFNYSGALQIRDTPFSLSLI